MASSHGRQGVFTVYIMVILTKRENSLAIQIVVEDLIRDQIFPRYVQCLCARAPPGQISNSR
jgi:hypothetical protein